MFYDFGVHILVTARRAIERQSARARSLIRFVSSTGPYGMNIVPRTRSLEKTPSMRTGLIKSIIGAPL